MSVKIPVEVSTLYEGERVRTEAAYVDLGNPGKTGVELVRVRPSRDIEEGVVLYGPELLDMQEGGVYPLAILVEVAGEKLEEDLEGVFERRIHDFCNYIHGFMHLNSRDMVGCRVSKEAVEKGLRLKHVGQALIDIFKKEWKPIEKVRVTLCTDEARARDVLEKARKIFEKRDARLRNLTDEDADTFYGCIMCQSFASKQMCVISPERTPGCGAISWLVARAAVKMGDNASIFEVPKGKVLDPLRGEYEGVNKARREKSGGEIERVYMYSLFEHPHSTGLMEAIVFYIPEVRGVGVVSKDFIGSTPLGINYASMSKMVGIGEPVDGFVGVSLEHLRSRKFLKADGGWSRVVWLSKSLREKLLNYIPEDLRDKIATEETVRDLKQLKEHVRSKNHPIVRLWGAEESEEEEEKPSHEPRVKARVVLRGRKISILLEDSKIQVERIVFK
jgi:acetyl-CoA decarbonylase/synthase complex subunit beta